MFRGGIKVIIAGADGAAHLAGVMASQTILSVIGAMPSNLSGFDSLLSTVQMPAGMPVATVGIGSAGARNAGLLVVQILALADENLAEKLCRYRTALTNSVDSKNNKLQEKLSELK